MALTPFADGVWLDSQPVTIVGMPLTSTMSVARLAGEKLLLYSPVALTPERRAAIEALGTVAHLYAPNTFHHLHMAEWAAAFPSARVHAPPGLRKKRPDLRVDRTIGAEPEPDFAGVLDEQRIEGFRLEECVLVHRPSRALICADLVHNVGRPEGAWTRFYTRAMGFYDQVALSKAIRWTGFSDESAARASIDRVLALPFERAVVGHGAPLPAAAKDAVAAAFTWLPTGP